MNETLHIAEQKPSPEQPRRFPLLLLIVAIFVCASLAFYFWTGNEKPPSRTTRQLYLPFGPAEQAYAPKILIQNIVLGRSENFLHQEVYSLGGEAVNTGDRSLRDVELTITFSDELRQAVLRESRVLFGAAAVSLAPGGRREFEISFEHIPSSWNREKPIVSVTGLQFSIGKV